MLCGRFLYWLWCCFGVEMAMDMATCVGFRSRVDILSMVLGAVGASEKTNFNFVLQGFFLAGVVAFVGDSGRNIFVRASSSLGLVDDQRIK